MNHTPLYRAVFYDQATGERLFARDWITHQGIMTVYLTPDNIAEQAELGRKIRIEKQTIMDVTDVFRIILLEHGRKDVNL